MQTMRNLTIYKVDCLVIRAYANVLYKSFPNLVSHIALVNLRLVPESMSIPIGFCNLANRLVDRNVLNVDWRINELRSKRLKLLRRVNVKVPANTRSHCDSTYLQGLVNNFLNDAERQDRREMLK